MDPSVRKVRPGESALPALLDSARHNAVTDGLAYIDQQKHKEGGGPDQLRLQPGIVQIRNESGGALARFDILGISGVVPVYADNNDAFKAGPALTGATPDIDDHAGKFVVLLAPCADDEFAQAMIMGTTVCRVNVTDAKHDYADIKDASATELYSGLGGSAQILWKESGTGTKLAYVRLGASGGSRIIHGLSVGAVAITDSTFNIDNVYATAGPSPVASAAITIEVENSYDHEGDDNSVCHAVWCVKQRVLESLQLLCPT